jgi:uncharacterized damage-inducible protein DinB
MNLFKVLYITLFVLIVVHPALAQSSDQDPFFRDLIGQLHFSEQRLTSLAEAVPQDKYDWRPDEGVRSIGEVYLHAGGANYFLLSFLGGKMPDGFTPDYEKSTMDKSEIIKNLKESFEYARNFISTLKSEDMDKEFELPFGKFSQRNILFIVLYHGHEHLGQSIAYARMNGITPPWSKGEE